MLCAGEIKIVYRLGFGIFSDMHKYEVYVIWIVCEVGSLEFHMYVLYGVGYTKFSQMLKSCRAVPLSAIHSLSESIESSMSAYSLVHSSN